MKETLWSFFLMDVLNSLYPNIKNDNPLHLYNALVLLKVLSYKRTSLSSFYEALFLERTWMIGNR